MEFASKFGYNYGFNRSDSESMSDEDDNQFDSAPQNSSSGDKSIKKRKIKVRKADLNIIAVRFEKLILPNEAFAGEPNKCSNCDAIMTSFSKKSIKILDSQDGEESKKKKIWSCEFCYHENDITDLISDIDHQLPGEDDVTFLLEAPPVQDATHQLQPITASSNISNTMLSFCIDISGSMNTRIEDHATMSRLEAVKVACLENLTKIKNDDPNAKIGLLTFSSDVKFYGDCSKNTVLFDSSFKNGRARTGQRQAEMNINDNSELEIPSDLLTNQESMVSFAQNQNKKHELKGINESFIYLQEKIKHLRTEGMTALGPALAFSVGYSCKQTGSQIILCTDGCANVGMGNIEQSKLEDAEKFYDDISAYAKDAGVTVNVISMKGTDCKLSLLGKLSEKTNGTLSIVNPLDLSDKFTSILQNKVVATNVKAKLIVNSKYLYIRNNQLDTAEGIAADLNKLDAARDELDALKKSVVEKEIGNANIDTEITYEYGIRRVKNENPDEAFKELPFQLQIIYTGLDGSTAVRVYTKVQKFTRDRKEAEDNFESEDLVFVHGLKKMSHQVLSNNTAVARQQQKTVDSLRSRMKVTAPVSYHSKEVMIRNFRKDKKMLEMNDEEAEEMYDSSNISRNKIKKDPKK